MQRILTVDDDPDIVELVKTRLQQKSYHVICAANGKEGLKKARKETPDLILMDIMMPRMTGGDAVKMLQDYDTTKNIPVIFLTAVASPKSPMGEENQRINVGGEHFPALGKPFDSEDLLSVVRRHLPS